MTAPFLLDITRSVERRLRGSTPSGIDRVCDAYAAHFAQDALAVLQICGRSAVFNRATSRSIFAALPMKTSQFRRKAASLFAKLPRCLAAETDIAHGLYLNVGHTGFDLAAHWNWVRRHRMRPVYLLHDLIPLTHPHLTTPHKTGRHRGRVVGALEDAAGIIVTSKAAAGDLQAFADSQTMPLPPVLTAPIAGAAPAMPSVSTSRYNTAFVSVGTIEARKNHTVLLQAWSLLIDQMGDTAPQLVLAGSWGLRSGQVRSELRRDFRLKNHITVQTGLDDAELEHLVSNARAVLLPSLAEGFGLPLVEALQRRTPVIASNLPSFREIGQNIPTLLDGSDSQLWAATIREFCNNGAELQRQLTAMESFCAPSWDAHFLAVAPWLNRIVNSAATARIPRNPCASGDNHLYRASKRVTGRNRETQC